MNTLILNNENSSKYISNSENHKILKIEYLLGHRVSSVGKKL